MEVTPAINCALKDTGCVREKVRVAERFSEWIHLDIADGRFTFNKTWGDAEAWIGIASKLKLEVHLMVEEPEKLCGNGWTLAQDDYLFHAETVSRETSEEIIALAQAYGAEVMLSFSPETELEKAADYLDLFSEFQILAVNPGLPAQNFLPLVLEKVRALREKYPNAKIEMDGGMNNETGKLAREAGADILISASYIFGSMEPSQTYKSLLIC